MKARRLGWWTALLLSLSAGTATAAPELLYFVAREQLRRIDIDTIDDPPLLEDVLLASTGPDQVAIPGPLGGGNVNGTPCFFPDGSYVMGEDAGQPHPPPGWGVYDAGSRMIGKLVATGATELPEPSGCAIDAEGRLLTVEVGTESFTGSDGQLILWFPPYADWPGLPTPYPNESYSTNYCKLAIDIGTPTNVVIDDEGRVLVTSPRAGVVYRYTIDFPTGPDAAGGCGRTDATGAPLVDAGRVARTAFINDSAHVATPSGIARSPSGGWYVGEVLFGRMAEYDVDGHFVRMIVNHDQVGTLPTPFGNPQSIAVDSQGTVYYADLALEGGIFDPDTGSNGKVWRVRFDGNGDPLEPEILESELGFPDGVAVRPGNLEPKEWRTLGGSPSRTYYNPEELTVTIDNVGQLVKRWEFPTTAIVTASPIVAAIDVPGEGHVPLVFFQDWNQIVHAVRIADGSELWSFQADLHPGASYPGSASATVETVDGVDRVFIGSGERMYALDAATGAEVWRFIAGTGCRDELGDPPGLCSFTGERNQIESTPAIVADTVVFGMDVDDKELGKGGVFGVDVRTGHLKWFFDLESGDTCRPDPGDEITRYDGYHSADELGLPADFFATRTGCASDRTATGCGNVWSSPAVDFARQRLYTVSSNCDTDSDPQTNKPGPNMPPYDEAIFALDFDGNAVWRWRPREVDPNDLAFGAVPNLFTIEEEGGPIDVLGVGGKDGTYYVLDRDGINERNGVAWNDADPSTLPYWRQQVVPGGAIGGIIASAAADSDARRIYFSTAPGLSVYTPQRPTMHALDMDTGAILWDNGTATGLPNDASYAPTSAIPGVAFTGTVFAPQLRAWNAETGALEYAQVISDVLLANAIASPAVVVDGTLLVGNGIGTRTGDPHDVEDGVSREPRSLIALCVPGTRGCGACQNGLDDDHDAYTDTDDPGCDDENDTSEHTDALACDDGLDNDGDGNVDLLDAGCPGPVATYEDTQCDDGLDNNGDETVDYDDPNCKRNWPYWETPPCGLGAELALVLPALMSAARRARDRRPRPPPRR
jgi:outer membrane protein assembly factor BamB